MRAFTQMQQWPADTTAAAVLTPAGIESTGAVDQQFRLASVTKPLVAYAALIAVEEGAIELDQPAGPPGSTVRHLLAHTSGVAFDSPDVRAAPGTRRIYSSAGFELLAAFIAAETGIAFPDYLSEAVFEPLGMPATALHGSAGHGAVSTVTDLTRFAAELQRPTLISGGLHTEARTVQFPDLGGVLPGFGNQRPNDWGLGFEIRDGKTPHWTGTGNSPRTYGHFGQSGTFLWVDPAIDVACVVLTDADFGDWARADWPPFSDAVLADIG